MLNLQNAEFSAVSLKANHTNYSKNFKFKIHKFNFDFQKLLTAYS